MGYYSWGEVSNFTRLYSLYIIWYGWSDSTCTSIAQKNGGSLCKSLVFANFGKQLLSLAVFIYLFINQQSYNIFNNFKLHDLGNII